MSYWNTDKGQLACLDDVRLQELADKYGLYDHLSDDADLPDRNQMIDDIAQAAQEDMDSEADEAAQEQLRDFQDRNPGYEGSIADAQESDDEQESECDNEEDVEDDEDDEECY